MKQGFFVAAVHLFWYGQLWLKCLPFLAKFKCEFLCKIKQILQMLTEAVLTSYLWELLIYNMKFEVLMAVKVSSVGLLGYNTMLRQYIHPKY
jgi:hypothetical protein